MAKYICDEAINNSRKYQRQQIQFKFHKLIKIKYTAKILIKIQIPLESGSASPNLNRSYQLKIRLLSILLPSRSSSTSPCSIAMPFCIGSYCSIELMLFSLEIASVIMSSILGQQISAAMVGNGISSWSTSNEDLIWRPSKRSGWLHTYKKG